MTNSSSSAETGALFAPGIAAYVALAAAALLATLPFLIPVHVFLFPTFYQEGTAFGLGLALVAALAAGPWRGSGIDVPRLAILLVLFGIFVYCQGYLVPVLYQEHAETWMWYLLWAAALIFAGRAMRIQLGAVTVVSVLATAVTIGALLSAGTGLAQWLQVAQSLSPCVAWDQGSRITGNIMQPNLLANYLVLGVVSAAYLWSARKIGPSVFVVTIFILAFVLQLSASRASLLMLGGLAVAAVIYRLRVAGFHRDGANRWLRAALIVCALLLLGVGITKLVSDAGVGMYAVGDVPAQRLVAPQEPGIGNSNLRRLFLIEQASLMFLSSPLFGIGAGGFAWGSYWTDTVLMHIPEGGYGTEDNAHNIVMHLVAEFGIVGLLFVCFLAVMAAKGVTRDFRARASPELVWVAAMVIAEMLHSLVEFPLWHAHFLGLTMLALGVSAEGIGWQPRWKVMGVVLGGLVIVGAGLLAVHWVAHDRLLALGRFSAESGGTIRSNDVQWIRKTLFAPYVDYGIARTLAMNREDLERKREFNERIMRFRPVSEMVHRHILLLTMAGRDEEARALLDRTKRVDGLYFSNLGKALAEIPGTEIPADSWLREAVRAK